MIHARPVALSIDEPVQPARRLKFRPQDAAPRGRQLPPGPGATPGPVSRRGPPAGVEKVFQGETR
jgi:hypothetical protein